MGKALLNRGGGVCMADLTGRTNALIGTVIGLVVILAIIGATFGLMQSSIADVNADLSNASLNDTTANTIAGVFPILVGVTFVLGIVGLIVGAIKFRRS